jgi:predicted alpha-1,2-mannosidase
VSQFVDPFIGTAGGGDTFPGADLPFGMVQWSPDTLPRGSITPGGYSYLDSTILGFSLTHLSGAGCFAYGTPSFLPTTRLFGETSSRGALYAMRFHHRHEMSSPGYYSVRAASGVREQLTVTQRTGISVTGYPARGYPGMIVRVGNSEAGGAGALRIVSPDTVEGWSDSGRFCNHGLDVASKVYFAAMFDHPFHVQIRSKSGAVPSAAYLSFHGLPMHALVTRVGVSFVSVHEALMNVADETESRSFAWIRQAAALTWARLLSRIRLGGAKKPIKRVFYTALYHSFLQPNVIDDSDGTYRGFDGKVHQDGSRRQYANFALWDIYRSEIPLLAVLAPQQTSDMMESLVRDAGQAGWLPRWPQANGDTGVMVGDPADPAIANAYRFGARNFNARSALRFMVRGATVSGAGLHGDRERPGLSGYLRNGYVAARRYGSAAMTLEYASDDYSIAQLARELGRRMLSHTFLRRSENWRRLFDPAIGMIEPRLGDGRFLPSASATTSNGFVEGTAAQYTWLVPSDLHGLFRLMGKRSLVLTRLGWYFRRLNAGPASAHEWIGNEPGFATPWEYDWLAHPVQTERVLHRIVSLFTAAPNGLPGNDDLGALSSWCIWALIGLYPEVPGVAGFATSAPQVRKVSILLPNERVLVINKIAANSVHEGLPRPIVNGKRLAGNWIGWSSVADGGSINLPSLNVS